MRSSRRKSIWVLFSDLEEGKMRSELQAGKKEAIVTKAEEKSWYRRLTIISWDMARLSEALYDVLKAFNFSLNIEALG